jgi:hypothetical protein
MILTRNDSGEQEGDIGQPVHVMVCLCMSEEDGSSLPFFTLTSSTPHDVEDRRNKRCIEGEI